MISRHPPELINRICGMWNDGLTASMISRELNGTLSRNAVIGIVDRHKNKRVKKRGPKPVSAPVPFKAKRIRFIDRRLSECAYVLGEVHGTDTMCCGNRVEEGFSWCSYHLDRVTDRQARRRRRAA